MPYVSADRSLPRSLDVQISLSRAQAETRTDLSIMCLAAENLGLIPNSNRVRFYSTIEAVENDYAVGSEAHFGASAFFDQAPHATTMAIGEVFLSNLPAQNIAAELTADELAAAILIADGNLSITYDIGAGSVVVDLDALDLTAAVTVEDIAAVIQGAITTAGSPLTATVKTLPDGAKRLVLATSGLGDGILITYPSDTTTGTFLGDLLNLTSDEGGQILGGHTATNIGDELSSIQNAAAASDKFIYGWALGASLRDAAIQETAAAWALSRTAITALVTNDVNAVDPSYLTDIGTVISATGNKRAIPIYHDNPQRYPDVSILAYMLSVNYLLPDSTVTAKFKVLPGIETVQLTETEWATLQSKGLNTYTAIGNDARTYRDGTSAADSWYMDTVINLDNFTEDLSVNVFNVFLRNKKIPYTRAGQALLVDACRDTGYQYTFNGTFADREVLDSTTKAGNIIVPAVQVIPTNIALMSAAERASRVGPPIEMVVQEAGAIHSVAINVDVVS